MSQALIVLAASISLFLTGCKELEVGTIWTDSPIDIDGSASEWADLETTYFEEQQALIGLSNDHDNIYLIVRFGDPSWIQTMRMGSLTVWLDISGSKKEKLGIRYYGGPQPARIADQRNPDEGRIIPTRLTVVTTDPDKETSIPPGGSRGPSAAFLITSGLYTCEMRIPMLDSSGSGYGIEIEPGESLMIGLKLQVNREQMMQSMQRGTGGMGGRGGMGGMGGMMGGRSRGGSAMPREEKLWINTVISEPPPEDY
jgi:hypothetical protein